MRSEQEMLALILETAEHDDRIRAVMMNGSRTNPDAPRDIFQDFDIVYFVRDVAPFKRNLEWIRRFGELMIVQMPDDMQDPPPASDNSFVYLMQFADGNRIDLTVFPITKLSDREEDSLSLILLDKDALFKPLPSPDDTSYLPKPPTAKDFADCCNEFWWVCPYVAKGLWREEIVYAKTMLDEAARGQMMKMLTWFVGTHTQFSRSVGKFGKYLHRFLVPELWAMLERTYADASYERNWQALHAMADLFRFIAPRVGAHFGYEYPHDDDARVSAHLRHVQQLPKTAAEIY